MTLQKYKFISIRSKLLFQKSFSIFFYNFFADILLTFTYLLCTSSKKWREWSAT